MTSRQDSVSTRIFLGPELHQRLVVEAGMQRVTQNQLLIDILERNLPAVAPLARPEPKPIETTATK